MATNNTKHTEAKEKLKKDCGAQIKNLVICKKKYGQSYNKDCQTDAIKLAQCAAENFCEEQYEKMKSACGASMLLHAPHYLIILATGVVLIGIHACYFMY